MMRRQHDRRIRAASARAAVLLEVVLALVLFAAASTVIGIALNASIGSVERLRLSAHAADLSVTVFSELQLGIRSVGAEAPPVAGEGGTNAWTIEIVTQPWGDSKRESGALTDVEVILRHESGFVHRSRQVMKLKLASPFEAGVRLKSLVDPECDLVARRNRLINPQLQLGHARDSKCDSGLFHQFSSRCVVWETVETVETFTRTAIPQLKLGVDERGISWTRNVTRLLSAGYDSARHAELERMAI